MKKILLSFFITLISCVAFSQNMSVSSFRCIENDITARTRNVTDMNSELCALIIVNTPLQGLEFGSCNIEKTEQKTGAIWVFVSPGVKFITIMHRDLGQIRNYPFPEQIKPGTVYELVLQSAKITQIVEENITEQYLIIESKTPDAKIFINDEYLGRNSVRKFLPIAKEHSYRVEAPLYHSKSGNIKLNVNEKTTLKIDLDPAFGYLKVNTSPENGAEIEINGELQDGKTPFTSQKLKSGTYTVQALKPMYKSTPLQAEIKDGQTTEITINLISNFATANISCQDKDAEIYIDGEYKSKGSFKGQISEGSHQLEIKKKSHRTIKRTINAINGQSLSENIENLQAINGKLNIDSEPYDADIYIDGKHYGTTPNIISQILIGEHQLTLKKDGFKDLKETIKIEEGKIAEYKFKLQEQPKFTKFQLLQTLTGHNDCVYSASYSPDGTKIVSASDDKTIKIWDANTGECLKTLKGHNYAVNSASYSPDGTKIVSASDDKTIKIWNANTGECLQTLEGHNSYVLSASYSPDSKYVVSSSGDNTIKIWDVTTEKCLKTLREHSYFVKSISYSPDGSKFVSASNDNTIKIWTANRKKCLRTLNGHSHSVNAVSFSPNGVKIVSASSDKTIKIWDANTGLCLQTLKGHNNSVYSASYSPDGTKIVSASLDKTIKIWDANTGLCLQTLKGHNNSVEKASYSPDGTKIVSASLDKTIKIWGME